MHGMYGIFVCLTAIEIVFGSTYNISAYIKKKLTTTLSYANTHINALRPVKQILRGTVPLLVSLINVYCVNMYTLVPSRISVTDCLVLSKSNLKTLTKQNL